MTDWKARAGIERIGSQPWSNAGLALAAGIASLENATREAVLDRARTALRNSQPLYRLAFERWRQRTEGLPGGDFRTLGRTILGLGRDSVLETGISLHAVYGVPVIPGSALKGLCAHYCDEVWGESNELFRAGGQVYQVLFGDLKAKGYVSFHDGWIRPEALSSNRAGLLTDVLTPHHPKWPKELTAPSDTDDPVPVTFLSVAGTFRIVVETELEGGEKERVEQMAMMLVEQALKEWGIGGKTSSGYGRMEREAKKG